MNHNWKIIEKSIKYKINHVVYDSTYNKAKICVICNQIAYMAGSGEWYRVNVENYGEEIINCTDFIVKSIIE